MRDDLLFLLNDLARLLRTDADRRARAHGMTRAQWATLVWLDRHPDLTQKALSALLEVEPITAARLLDRLERRGMVERRPDPADRRVWRLHLRPAARDVLEDIAVQRQAMLAMVTRDLEPETVRLVTAALLQMKASVCGQRRVGGEAAVPQSAMPESAVLEKGAA